MSVYGGVMRLFKMSEPNYHAPDVAHKHGWAVAQANRQRKDNQQHTKTGQNRGLFPATSNSLLH
jgi:hypothetical protein